MEHRTRPFIRNTHLVIGGALIVMAITLYGVLDDPGEVIRNDVRFGPFIAAGRVLVPLFVAMGVVYFLSGVRRCQACGKIFFWRHITTHKAGSV
ncbi:MAG: hypothetical protein HQL60_06255 [Magnetococcales bacterium]|nr:hypothetical protein [Magnetococcales bacterium]